MAHPHTLACIADDGGEVGDGLGRGCDERLAQLLAGHAVVEGRDLLLKGVLQCPRALIPLCRQLQALCDEHLIHLAVPEELQEPPGPLAALRRHEGLLVELVPMRPVANQRPSQQPNGICLPYGSHRCSTTIGQHVIPAGRMPEAAVPGMQS